MGKNTKEKIDREYNYLYHIKRPNMGLHEGYIGVSKHPYKRLKQHRKCVKFIVGKALNKYSDCILEVIFESPDLELCYNIEKRMRPTEYMGWNMAMGGIGGVSSLGRGKGAVNLTVYNLTNLDGRVFVGNQWQFMEEYPKTNQGNLNNVLNCRGKKYVVDGWYLTSNGIPKANIIHTFTHDIHGLFIGTQSDLRVKYNLHSGSLSEMVSGYKNNHRKSVKGWKLTKE